MRLSNGLLLLVEPKAVVFVNEKVIDGLDHRETLPALGRSPSFLSTRFGRR